MKPARGRSPQARRDSPKAGGGSTPSWWYVALLAIALAGAAAYANGLSGPFVYDDLLAVVQNASIRHLASLDVFQPERELPVAGRPVVNLSFALNYAVHGVDVRGYHAVNIAIHLWNALLVAGIIRRTVVAKSGDQVGAAVLAMACAAMWVVHPLASEAVSYVTQRSELMFAWALLATLYASIRAAASSTGVWIAFAVAACALGMGCKETMAVTPIVVMAYDRVFRYQGWRETLTRRAGLYGALCATWIVLGVLMMSGPRSGSAGFSTAVSSSTYLLNQAQVLVRYLRLSVLPTSLVLHYGEPVPMTVAAVWPQLVLLAALGVAAAIALWRGSWLGFVGAWAFAILGPTSSIVPIATEVGAERRMYLPLVAIVVLLAAGVTRALRRLMPAATSAAGPGPASEVGALSPAGLRVSLACAAIAVIVLGVRTHARNAEYQTALQLAVTSFERWPTPVAEHMVGTELAALGRHDEAIAHMRRSVQGFPRGLYDLGVELFNRREYTEAIDVLGRFIAAEPALLEVPEAHTLIARAALEQGRAAEAIGHLELATRMQPAQVAWQGLLADALFRAGQYGRAAAQYEVYVKSYPQDGAAYTNLGIARAAEGATNGAVDAFTRAAQIDSGSASAHRNVANALLDARRFQEALPHAERAVTLDAGDAVAHDILGLARLANGQVADAVAAFDRAVALAPGDPELRAHAALARQRLASDPRRGVTSR